MDVDHRKLSRILGRSGSHSPVFFFFALAQRASTALRASSRLYSAESRAVLVYP